MTFEAFDAFTDALFAEVREMRDTKGREYAGERDRFDNFNRLAARLDLDRKKVWHVYFTKHLDAIESYIRDGQTHSKESIRGRIVDAITYLSLLAGMVAEEEEKRAQPVLATHASVPPPSKPIIHFHPSTSIPASKEPQR